MPLKTSTSLRYATPVGNQNICHCNAVAVAKQKQMNKQSSDSTTVVLVAINCTFRTDLWTVYRLPVTHQQP